jgi:nicotinamidase-related amidase
MQGLNIDTQVGFINKFVHLVKLAKVLEIPLIITAEDINKNGTIPDLLLESLPIETHIFDKFVFSCWGQKNIQEAIKKTSRSVAVICGLETDVCVAQTAIDLLDNDYRVFLLTDLTYSRNPTEHKIGMKRMEYHGVVLSLLKSWQEEIAAGVRTSVHQILIEKKLNDI